MMNVVAVPDRTGPPFQEDPHTVHGLHVYYTLNLAFGAISGLPLSLSFVRRLQILSDVLKYARLPCLLSLPAASVGNIASVDPSIMTVQCTPASRSDPRFRVVARISVLGVFAFNGLRAGTSGMKAINKSELLQT
jgi:hypothetical protein